MNTAKGLTTIGFFGKQLETEHEKIFPFEPLHCFNIPTVPGLVLDRELAEDESKVLHSYPTSLTSIEYLPQRIQGLIWSREVGRNIS